MIQKSSLKYEPSQINEAIKDTWPHKAARQQHESLSKSHDSLPKSLEPLAAFSRKSLESPAAFSQKPRYHTLEFNGFVPPYIWGLRDHFFTTQVNCVR